MKLLVATEETQGRRDSDFAWCTPGEVVSPVVVICDGDKHNGPDSGCGCGRSFKGLTTHKATTTAEVRDIDGVTLDGLIKMVHANLDQAGWAEFARFIGEDLNEKAAVEAAALAAVAEKYDEGTVLEIRLGEVGVRPVLRGVQ